MSQDKSKPKLNPRQQQSEDDFRRASKLARLAEKQNQFAGYTKKIKTV